jgi:NADH:ubiquinone oxidoreductase subunit 5 (subunit L)/multisubunit Na+/H+ antiporter MnhA subunit
MPQTAFAVLIGAVAIAALPPLNGFVSEWLTFQAILASPDLPQWALKILVPAVGALMALAAALVAAAFVKAYGISFLGRPRTAAAADARETDGFSLAAMFMLAGLCLAAGILPGVVIDTLSPAVHDLIGARMPPQLAIPWLSIVPFGESRSSYNGLLVFLFIAISSMAAAFFIHRLASRRVRRAPAWDCGFPLTSPATQYSAGSFSQPIRRVFATTLFRAREEVAMPAPGDPAPARFRAVTRDLAWEGLYLPTAVAVEYAATRLNYFQFLTIRRYLSLVFAALVVLLLVLAIWS